MRKILIIKTGYSETLDKVLNVTASLGDVLRTTFILHYFKNDEVSWLVHGKAAPLLEGNRYINRILVYNPFILDELRKEKFDLIINLEKVPKICSFSESLNAERIIGFSFNGLGRDMENYLDYLTGNKELIEINKDIEKKRNNQHCLQKIIADAIGKEWNEEEYILGYKPASANKYDVGFNWTTSSKWSNKAWPDFHWKRLANSLEGQYSVSWQQGLANLRDYIEWINSCRLIVTADTLGLHVSLALKKKVIALFGPTSPKEIYFYNCGTYLVPDADYSCIPCLEPTCGRKKQCMELITPEKVRECINYEFEKDKAAQKI